MKMLKKSLLLIALVPCLAFASPLMNSWQGSGADANKRFCEYGDGQITTVPASQNCPLSN